MGGTRRTAITAAGLLLQRSCWRRVASNAKGERTTRRLASTQLSPDGVAAWFEVHAQPLAVRAGTRVDK